MSSINLLRVSFHTLINLFRMDPVLVSRLHIINVLDRKIFIQGDWPLGAGLGEKCSVADWLSNNRLSKNSNLYNIII